VVDHRGDQQDQSHEVIVIFYFTDLLSVTLRYHVGHEFMMAHFLFTGYMTRAVRECRPGAAPGPAGAG
jgi:hypothetical protein